MTRAEREALELLRRIGKRRHFRNVFSDIARRAKSDPSGSCWLVWSDIEELLAIDLERK